MNTPRMTPAERQAKWRTNNPDAWKAARARYYSKNRRALILVQRIRQAGVKPPSLAEARQMLGAP